MDTTGLFERIKRAIESAPRNGYVAEFHLQVIKYADLLDGVSSKEFCEKLDLAHRGNRVCQDEKIAQRLRDAGLQPELL